MLDYYKTLEVTQSASPDDLRRAFRRLAKRWHPDRAGGNARRFALVREAYGVLSDPGRRRLFDLERHRAPVLRSPLHPGAPAAGPRSGVARGTGWPAPTVAAAPRSRRPVVRGPERLTRVMSIAVPIEGAVFVAGLAGSLHVQPTTADTLWRSTLKKFGHDNVERLARHVVQVRVTGDGDVVRAFAARAAAEGVMLDAEEAARNARARHGLARWLEAVLNPLGRRDAAPPPLAMQMTLPSGTTLVLDGFSGFAELGHLDANLIARIAQGQLRAGRLRQAMLTAQGRSHAMLTAMTGAADIVGQDESHSTVMGRMPRLRTALEGQSRLEVLGQVGRLEADLGGHALLRVRLPLETARCRVRGASLAELNTVARPPVLHESEGGRVRMGAFAPAGRQRSA